MSEEADPIIGMEPEIPPEDVPVDMSANTSGSPNGGAGLRSDAGSNGDGKSHDDPSGEDNGSSIPLAGRILSRGTRGVQRVAGATGLDRTIETAAEEAIVRAVESEATERAIARIINGPIIENAVREALQSDAVRQSVLDTIDSELVDQVWARVLASNETEMLIKRIAEAPEVRAAIASQSFGLIDDLGLQVRRVTRVLDGLAEKVLRRVFFRKEAPATTDRVGGVTRILALALDAFIINISLLAISAGIGLVLSVFGYTSDGGNAPAIALGATTWFVVSSLYLFTFWSLSGQTPGMRFLDIRIEVNGTGDHHIGGVHARRRLVGFWLAAIPFGLGFIGVVLRRDRRGFHDRLGNTSVFYIDNSKPGSPHELIEPDRN